MHGALNPGVQGEEEGPGDILDEELQKQLNEIADYDSGDEAQPVIQGKLNLTPCSLIFTIQSLHRDYARMSVLASCATNCGMNVAP